MLSWVVKTETAENTDQGPKWLMLKLSEIKDVANRIQLWSEPGSRYL